MNNLLNIISEHKWYSFIIISCIFFIPIDLGLHLYGWVFIDILFGFYGYTRLKKEMEEDKK